MVNFGQVIGCIVFAAVVCIIYGLYLKFQQFTTF